MANSDTLAHAEIGLLPVRGGKVNFQVSGEPDLQHPSSASETAMIVSLCLVVPTLFILYWMRLSIARVWLGIEDEGNRMDIEMLSALPPSARDDKNATFTESPSPDGNTGGNELPTQRGGRRRTDLRVMDIVVPEGVQRVGIKDLTAVTKNFGFSETGEVYLARWKHDGDVTQVLAKELTPAKEKQAIRWRRIFQEQLETLAKISHPNILRLLAFAEGDKPCQVMEYPQLGCLNVYLTKARVVLANESKQGDNEITRRNMLTMAVDACTAVAYLVSRDIVHGDLAARHCFVTAELRLKLSCHELSQESLNWEYEPLSNDRSVAVRWSAPEVLNQSLPATAQTDIWSLGVLMWEIFSKGKQPFGSMSMDEVMQNVIQGSVHKQPEYANTAVYDVMRKCWKTTPHERPPAAQLAEELESLSSRVEEKEDTATSAASLELRDISAEPSSVRSTGGVN